MAMSWRGLGGAGLFLAGALGCNHLQTGKLTAESPAAAPPGRLELSTAGPTLRLDAVCGSKGDASIPAREFMYFIPLISPEVVDCTISAGSSQRVMLESIERTRQGNTFALRCWFALVGTGVLQNDYDHAAMVNRNAQTLRGGGRLTEILGFIRVEGEGKCTLDACGEFVGGVPVVQRVALGFAGVAGPSPVRIGLFTISGTPEAWSARTDAVAYVSSLAFTRSAAPPRMDVSLASLRDPQAGDGLAEQLKGALKGAIANLLIPPVTIEASGNLAMLEFAAALYAGAPSFAFPQAQNLRSFAVIPLPPAAPAGG